MKRTFEFAIATVLSIFFFGCSNEKIQSIGFTPNKFDYTLFESLKGEKVNIGYPENIVQLSSVIEKNRAITDHINNQLGVNLSLTSESIEYASYSTYEIIEIGLKEGFFNIDDREIILQLQMNLGKNDFDSSLKTFEYHVLSLNLPLNEFKRYNTWANILKVINQENPNALLSNNIYSNQQRGCLSAILAYSGATVAVGVACVPNPVALIACPLAIALKALAYYNMIDTCKKKKINNE